MKNDKISVYGYFKTPNGYWVTTAPKGWKYNFKDKVWVFNG